MDIQVKSSNLRRAVAIASKVIESRSSIPILGMVHCHANGALEVTGTASISSLADTAGDLLTRLRGGNPEWGLRDMDDLGALADRAGLRLTEAVPMPANNFVLVFTRRA